MWAWCASARGKVLSWRIFPESSEARQRARAWGIVSSNICNARGCCCIWWISRLIRPSTRRWARAIMDELRRYDVALYEKPRWLVFNKTDQIPDELQKTCIENFIQRLDWKGPIFALSALTRQGCAELIQAIYQYLACKTPVPVQ